MIQTVKVFRITYASNVILDTKYHHKKISVNFLMISAKLEIFKPENVSLVLWDINLWMGHAL